MYLIENVKKYQNGDEKAFENIYHGLEKILKNINYKFKDEEILDILICYIPEMILKLNVIELGDDKYLLNYMRKAFFYKALDIKKRMRKEKEFINYNTELLNINSNREDNAFEFQSDLIFYDLISNLTTKEQLVIKKYFKEQESISNIADEIGVSRQFVNKIKNNALIKLKEALYF